MIRRDPILQEIEHYLANAGAQCVVQRINKGYSILDGETGAPVTRFRMKDEAMRQVEVLWWSHRDKWDSIGDFGGMIMSLNEALDFVKADNMGIFWR